MPRSEATAFGCITQMLWVHLEGGGTKKKKKKVVLELQAVPFFPSRLAFHFPPQSSNTQNMFSKKKGHLPRPSGTDAEPVPCVPAADPVPPRTRQTDSLTGLPPRWNDGTCGWSHNREGWRIKVWSLLPIFTQLCSIFPLHLTDFLEKCFLVKEKSIFFFFNFDGNFWAGTEPGCSVNWVDDRRPT